MIVDGTEDEAYPEDEYMTEAQLEDVAFYDALSPIDALPLLAVSGVNGKGYWIGSTPVPPEEEASSEEDSGDDVEDEETKELMASSLPSSLPHALAPPTLLPFAPPNRTSPKARSFPTARLLVAPSPKNLPSVEIKRWPLRVCSLLTFIPTPFPHLHPPSPQLQEIELAKVREERRDVAMEMARLWKEDPEQWLVRSKVVWAARHNDKRGKRPAAAVRAPPRFTAEKAVAGAGAASRAASRGTYGSKRPVGIVNRPGRATVSLKMLMVGTVSLTHPHLPPEVITLDACVLLSPR